MHQNFLCLVLENAPNSKYKVGISGFYKKPLFSVLYSEYKKAVMADDTSYFICFKTYDMAYVAMLILNTEIVESFFKRIAFLDTKRPYTKKYLRDCLLKKVLDEIDFFELENTEAKLDLPKYINKRIFFEFIGLP